MHGFVLDEVTVARRQTRLLDDISAHIPADGCTAVVGPSGAGKSTLLRLLNRLSEPTHGRVLIDGVSVAELDVLALRRRVGLVAQHPTLLTERVADELRVGRPDLTPDHLAGLLDRVGLPISLANRPTVELSGGEAQRVCLARALAVAPEVLVLDEPTSSLDGLNTALIADLARDHTTGGGTVVFASHDLAVIRRIADTVLVLDHGRLIQAGPADAVAYLQPGP
ncbi:ATP-binding cassette domain-containing protein [Mycobacterium sp.]|uniref:ATP-binding cassette domain-containing protein n=1 Tax=Mycobacterium sp. TaxID=1785 RepID=UPI002D6D64AF|nr:ATP-binding cassette domain-containing protein [Mycobacterium sp.]HZA09018.1 ATP-binding cassette domain-containing protein [Mycobacterium sp.]